MTAPRSHSVVLFTDIVDSTARASALGDRAWRALLRRHHAAVRTCLSHYLGQELNTAGDGFVARFDDPVRALLCASALRQRTADLGLDLRCGVHLGQIQGIGRDTSGIAVHIAARVAASAGGGEIVVSRTVRDAVQGAGFRFEDMGARTLKGVEGDWRLFRLTGLPGDAPQLEPRLGERLRHRIHRQRLGVVAALAGVGVLVAAFLVLRPALTTVADASEIRSVAVLPLANLSGDAGQDFFAQGMTEAMITELSKIGALRVISRSSSARFAERAQPLRQIADRLGVEGLVEGSVVRSGDRVRISAQLVHAGSDSQVWADSYEGELTDILRLQSRVARSIASAIAVTLTPEEEARLASTRRVDPEAYEDYLRGLFHLSRLTPESIERGMEYLRRAINKDPASALAYAGLALGHTLVASHSPDPPPDSFERARAAYSRALELDETVAEAHVALAEMRMYRDKDYAGAERAFRRALELNPNLSRGLAQYAWLVSLIGTYDEAMELLRQAQRVDPLTPLWYAWAADMQIWAGRIEEAVAPALEAQEVDPDFPWGLASYGHALSELGRHEEAIPALERAAASDPTWEILLGAAYANAGRTEEARRIAEGLGEDAALAYPPFLFAALEDPEQAMEWVERAVRANHPWTPWHFTSPQIAEVLRDNPRYRELARELRVRIPA